MTHRVFHKFEDLYEKHHRHTLDEYFYLYQIHKILITMLVILNYLNIELRRTRSKSFKKFLENYNRALSSRDAEKYVDGEQDVVDMEKIINEFALLRNQWLGITKGLDQKQWQITNIVKLRVAGMEDADIR